jgi:hypothetical protein
MDQQVDAELLHALVTFKPQTVQLLLEVIVRRGILHPAPDFHCGKVITLLLLASLSQERVAQIFILGAE